MKDAPPTIKLSLSRSDRELIRQYGYPFQGIEDAIDAVPESVDVADVLCDPNEVELLCNDLVRSINDCTDDDLQEEINELFEYIESAAASHKYQRSVVSRPVIKPEVMAAILRAVQDQLQSPETPEVRFHFQRLISLGHSDSEVRELIATVLVFYFNGLEGAREYTYSDYVAHLERLPEIDRGDDEDADEIDDLPF